MVQTTANWSLQQVPDMDDEQFRQWQMLLESRTGVCVSDQRRTYLQTSLSSRMRSLQIADYQSYYDYVTKGLSGTIEWSALIDHLTVRETSFMRHRPSFDCVGRYLQQRLEGLPSGQPLQLWSLGCASGEEAWSLAITLEQAMVQSGKRCNYGIWATDISLKALEQGREGRYAQSRLGGLHDTEVRRWLQAEESGQFRVNDSLREQVCFSRLNILELAQAPIQDMDIIFCQNLLIYFRRWRRRDLLNMLARRLVPGGMLVIGLGEITDWHNPLLIPVADDQVQAWVRRDDNADQE